MASAPCARTHTATPHLTRSRSSCHVAAVDSRSLSSPCPCEPPLRPPSPLRLHHPPLPCLLLLLPPGSPGACARVSVWSDRSAECGADAADRGQPGGLSAGLLHLLLPPLLPLPSRLAAAAVLPLLSAPLPPPLHTPLPPPSDCLLILKTLLTLLSYTPPFLVLTLPLTLHLTAHIHRLSSVCLYPAPEVQRELLHTLTTLSAEADGRLWHHLIDDEVELLQDLLDVWAVHAAAGEGGGRRGQSREREREERKEVEARPPPAVGVPLRAGRTHPHTAALDLRVVQDAGRGAVPVLVPVLWEQVGGEGRRGLQLYGGCGWGRSGGGGESEA